MPCSLWHVDFNSRKWPPHKIGKCGKCADAVFSAINLQYEEAFMHDDKSATVERTWQVLKRDLLFRKYAYRLRKSPEARYNDFVSLMALNRANTFQHAVQKVKKRTHFSEFQIWEKVEATAVVPFDVYLPHAGRMVFGFWP